MSGRVDVACDCDREMWQMHRAECAITKAHARAYRRPAADAIHAIGCLCGECSVSRERDAWDPRMGER